MVRETLVIIFETNFSQCYGCFVTLADDKMEYVDWDNKPFCKSCFLRLPGETKRKVNRYKDLEKKLNPVDF